MNISTKKTKGFTLIELMIVLCIIGVLAAIALISYSNYIVRSQTTRVYAELSHLKLDIDVCFTQKGSEFSSNCRLRHSGSTLLKGAPDSSLETPANPDLNNIGFPSIKWSETISSQTEPVNIIKGVFGNGANTNIDGKSISLIRLSSGEWLCETSLPQNSAPAGCNIVSE